MTLGNTCSIPETTRHVFGYSEMDIDVPWSLLSCPITLTRSQLLKCRVGGKERLCLQLAHYATTPPCIAAR